MLDVDLRKAWVVLRHEEMRWKNTTLVCWRWSEEKVELFAFRTLVFNQTFVNDATAWRVLESTLRISNKEALWNSLVDNNDTYFRLLSCLVVQLVDSSFKLRDFSGENLVTLGITDSISEDDEGCWEFTFVILCESRDRFFNQLLHVVLNNLLTFLLNQVSAVVLAHFLVDACREANNWLRTWVTNVNTNQHGSLLA